MAGREDLFNHWLKRAVLDSAADARLLLEQGEEDEEQDEQGEEGDTEEELMAAPTEEEESRGGPQQAQAATREVPPPKPDDLTMELIVDKLNAIRSGKSLKDKGVQHRIGEYFNDLNLTQRLALFAFLEGLAEVIATEVSGDDARAPDDPDVRVNMEHEESDEEVEEQPGQARVAKPESEEYADGDAKRVSRGSQRGSSADAPNVTRDAEDDAPVMVVNR